MAATPTSDAPAASPAPATNGASVTPWSIDRAKALVDAGADAVKALALGARAVGLGRPYVYALALGGEEGVGAFLDHFLAELELTLALSGVGSLEELGPHFLAKENPPPQGGRGGA